MSASQWRTTSLPRAGDDVLAMSSLVSSGLFDSYVTYGRAGVRWFAGNVLADMTVDAERAVCAVDGDVTSRPVRVHPLRTLGDVVREWRLGPYHAYGYVTFEAGRLVHGSSVARKPSGVLAYLMVPQVEVQWTSAGTTVSSVSDELMRRVVDVLGSSFDLPSAHCTPVELDGTRDRARYEDAVDRARGAILRNQLKKVIVSRRVEVPFPVDLLRSHVHGLRRTAHARSFLLDLGGRRAAGLSPEIVVEVNANGSVTMEPLAGTRRIDRVQETDRRLREELRWDVKECFEHVISARHACEEMYDVCDPRSVAVRDLMTVKERGTVQHLGSTVSGQLTAGCDAWDALAAAFPAVTASGIPKRPALDLIAELEEDERGLYAGAVCRVGYDGTLDSALVLRTVFQEGGTTWLRAGAGIVEGSVPPREFDETSNKLRSVAGSLVAVATDGHVTHTGADAGHVRASSPPSATEEVRAR